MERIAAEVEANRSTATPLVLIAHAETRATRPPDLDDTVRRLRAFAAASPRYLYTAAGRTCWRAADSQPWSAADRSVAEGGRISVGSALARAAGCGFFDAARTIRSGGDFACSERCPDHG